MLNNIDGRNTAALTSAVNPAITSGIPAEEKVENSASVRPTSNRAAGLPQAKGLPQLIEDFIINKKGFIHHATLSTLGEGHRNIKNYMHENHFTHVVMHGLLDGLSVDKNSNEQANYFDRSFSGELRMQVAESVLTHLGVADGFSEDRTNLFKIQTPSLASLNNAQLATCYSQISNLAKMLYMDVASNKELVNNPDTNNLGRKLSMIAMNGLRLSQQIDNSLKSSLDNNLHEFKNLFSILDEKDKAMILTSIEHQQGSELNPWYKDIIHKNLNSTVLDFKNIKPLDLEEVTRIASWTQHLADHLMKLVPADGFTHIHSALKIPFLSVEKLDSLPFERIGARTVLNTPPEFIPYEDFSSYR